MVRQSHLLCARQSEPEVLQHVHARQVPGKRKSSDAQFFAAPRGGKSNQPAVRSSSIPADLIARWMLLVNSVGALSTIWQDYHTSQQFDLHCQRLLEKFAPSTLHKYINTLQCIYSILVDFSWTWDDVGSHHLSDLLQIAHEGKNSEWGFGATTAIKALRWAQKLLLVSSWQMLYDPVINSFFSSNSHERRESIPLSLFLVSHERVHIARTDFAWRATLYVMGWPEIRRWTADFIAFTFMVHYCLAGFML